MEKQHTYIAIDLKSFYASAECVDRHLDPLNTNLVVADTGRTEKTICLAVSPSLKAYGIPGRARLFEVNQKVKEVNAQRLRRAVYENKAAAGEDGTPGFAGESYLADELAANPALQLTFVTARPRMKRYMEVSSQIYSLYLRYVSPEDIHPYSIDEVFMDVTGYLAIYGLSAHDLARAMIREVLRETGITATAGIGTNLYLCKLAMDIVAKHIPADEDGVRIAELNEQSFRYLLWDHKPLTDFWRTGPGTAKHLERMGIHTMGELARASLTGEDELYRAFGVDAEILIDHAWGYEPCTIRQIKQYRPDSNSLCEGQVLAEPYSCEKAAIIVREMADNLAFQLIDKGLVTDALMLDIGYDRENVDSGSYHGAIQVDRYGRSVPKAAHGIAHLDTPTNLSSQLTAAALDIYKRITNRDLQIRRLTITADHVVPDEGIAQMNLFADTRKLEKEKKLQQAMLEIKRKYNKNAVLKGTSFEEGATQRERNGMVGGHKA